MARFAQAAHSPDGLTRANMSLNAGGGGPATFTASKGCTVFGGALYVGGAYCVIFMGMISYPMIKLIH